MSRARKTIGLVAKLAVSATCIFLVVHKIDPAGLRQDLAQIRWSWLLLALTQFALLPILGGYRWHVVMVSLGNRLPLAVATRFFWIGMALSQVLPSISGGDAARILLAWRRGISLVIATQSVIIERAVMLMTLLVIVAVLQLAGPYKIPGPAFIGPTILGGTLLAMILVLSTDWLLSPLQRWKLSNSVYEFVLRARRCFMGASGARLAATSVTAHVNTALGCLWLGLSLGMPMHLTDYLFYVSLVTLVSTLPLSIGGWGVREGAFVYLLGPLGIASHTALAFSLLFGATVAAVSAVGLLYMWRSDSARPRDLCLQSVQPMNLKNT